MVVANHAALAEAPWGSGVWFCDFAGPAIGTESAVVRSLESSTRLLFQHPISASQDGGEFYGRPPSWDPLQRRSSLFRSPGFHIAATVHAALGKPQAPDNTHFRHVPYVLRACSL